MVTFHMASYFRKKLTWIFQTPLLGTVVKSIKCSTYIVNPPLRI